jgi:hypothetical protein
MRALRINTAAEHGEDPRVESLSAPFEESPCAFC